MGVYITFFNGCNIFSFSLRIFVIGFVFVVRAVLYCFVFLYYVRGFSLVILIC